MTLQSWICKVELNQAAARSVSEGEKDRELAALRKENAQLKEANEILRLASAFSPRRSVIAYRNSRWLYRTLPAQVSYRAYVTHPS